MFKKLISISLIIAVLATLVQFTVPYLWYYSNYNYIAQELCENRNHPERECNGSCQLKRMIKEQHNHDEGDAVPSAFQEYRVNLFFSEALYLSPVLTSFSSPLYSYTGTLETLWFEEPLSPPPKQA